MIRRFLQKLGQIHEDSDWEIQRSGSVIVTLRGADQRTLLEVANHAGIEGLTLITTPRPLEGGVRLWFSELDGAQP